MQEVFRHIAAARFFQTKRIFLQNLGGKLGVARQRDGQIAGQRQRERLNKRRIEQVFIRNAARIFRMSRPAGHT